MVKQRRLCPWFPVLVRDQMLSEKQIRIKVLAVFAKVDACMYSDMLLDRGEPCLHCFETICVLETPVSVSEYLIPKNVIKITRIPIRLGDTKIGAKIDDANVLRCNPPMFWNGM